MNGTLRGRMTALTAATVLAFGVLLVSSATAAEPGRTFEDDPAGQVPAGCVTPQGAAPGEVSGIRGFESAQSLRVNDQSAQLPVRVSCSQNPQQGGLFSFQVFPAALRNGFTVDLLGDVRDIAGQRSVYHLGVLPDGTVRWYDGLDWTELAPPGTVPTGAWSAVSIAVPADNGLARVSVGGKEVGEGGPLGIRNVTDISGFEFAGNGAEPAGDEVFFDNVNLGPAVDVPPQTGPFSVGAPVPIAESPTPIQMPNTAVTVPREGGSRVLVSYPAHNDDSAASGNRFAFSDDGGKTWADYQGSNPMPDAPSFNMTKLPGGDLLATNYHTYMIDGSGDTKAELDTAVSTDGGATWNRKPATMTTPEAMRPIADVTDRPGRRLGGFVLTHSAVQDADGTLYQSGYGYYANDAKYRQIVLTSTDGGANWDVRATVAYDPGLSDNPKYEGFDEGAIERAADGSLLIVMRTGSFQQMYTSRSTDNGATWSPPAPLTAGENNRPVVGVYPQLTRLPNGSLALLVGRPGESLLSSADGNGTSWTRPQVADYQNSANGSFTVLDDAHLVLFGDRGADWGKPQPAPYQVWARPVTVN